jgi:hypothetical protein
MTGVDRTEIVRDIPLYVTNFRLMNLFAYESLDSNYILYSSRDPPASIPNLIVKNIHSSRCTVLHLNFLSVTPGARFCIHPMFQKNSMLNKWVNGHTAGYFRDDLSDRLIVLDVSITHVGGTPRYDFRRLHISANNLLSYILSHPSELPIPWEAWTPGIARLVPPRPLEYCTLTGKHTVCGTRALSTHVVRNRFSQPVICVYDFHPQRVRYARSVRRTKMYPMYRMYRMDWSRCIVRLCRSL